MPELLERRVGTAAVSCASARRQFLTWCLPPRGCHCGRDRMNPSGCVASRPRRGRLWPVAVGADAVRRTAANPRFGRRLVRPRQGANGRARAFKGHLLCDDTDTPLRLATKWRGQVPSWLSRRLVRPLPGSPALRWLSGGLRFAPPPGYSLACLRHAGGAGPSHPPPGAKPGTTTSSARNRLPGHRRAAGGILPKG